MPASYFACLNVFVFNQGIIAYFSRYYLAGSYGSSFLEESFKL